MKERLSPASASVKVVTDWLETFGVKYRVSKYQNLIHVEVPISVASQMLQTEFAEFSPNYIQLNTGAKEIVVARITKPYSLPSEIAEHVLLVDDILRLGINVRVN